MSPHSELVQKLSQNHRLPAVGVCLPFSTIRGLSFRCLTSCPDKTPGIPQQCARGPVGVVCSSQLWPGLPSSHLPNLPLHTTQEH